jgi:2-dehydropantoate 2-reductase
VRPIERIGIIGAGAIGGVIGSLLYSMDKECVAFIADGERRDRLVRGGLIVNGRLFRIPVVPANRTSGTFDLVIVAVKNHHLSVAIEQLRGVVSEETLILSLMNGIDSEERIGAVFGMEKVVYSIIAGIGSVRNGNSITCSAQGKVFFGEADNSRETERIRRIRDLFDRCGIVYEIPADMIRTLWWKFMVNAGINQASAALRAPDGIFQTSGQARSLMESAMREVIAVAGKIGVHLSEKDILEWHKVLSGLAPDTKTSMLQDVEAGRKTEVEMLAGKIIELGKQFGVPTPVNEKLYSAIRETEPR